MKSPGGETTGTGEWAGPNMEENCRSIRTRNTSEPAVVLVRLWRQVQPDCVEFWFRWDLRVKQKVNSSPAGLKQVCVAVLVLVLVLVLWADL